MKVKNLKHHINWQDTWNKMREERVGKPKVSYDDAFFKKSAQDFSQRVKSNDYEFGRKATQILKQILDHDSEVLEIGTGPGTLTIPLATMVKKIVGIEFSERNLAQLKANLKDNGLNNVEIVQENWENTNDDEIKDKFDLTVCSHFLWQIEDIERLLKRMENASKKYCAIIQPCGRDEIVKEIFELLCSQKYTGQFDPDADYFAYVILREWGRLVNIGHFEYTFERGLEEEVRCVAGFTGKFIEIDQDVKKKIEGYLLNISKNGMYVEKNQAVVMWWQPEK